MIAFVYADEVDAKTLYKKVKNSQTTNGCKFCPSSPGNYTLMPLSENKGRKKEETFKAWQD